MDGEKKEEDVSTPEVKNENEVVSTSEKKKYYHVYSEPALIRCINYYSIRRYPGGETKITTLVTEDPNWRDWYPYAYDAGVIYYGPLAPLIRRHPPANIPNYVKKMYAAEPATYNY